MSFDVQQFRAKVRDLARKYQFEVEVLFPSVIGGGSDLVNILAESANFPGRKNTKVDADFMGAPYKLAGGVEYDDWQVTFRIDDNYDIYKKFRAWSELIKGAETQLAAFPTQYKSNPVMYQLDNNKNRLVAITLNGAWPNAVGDVAMDTKDSGLATLQVTFTYDYSIFKVL